VEVWLHLFFDLSTKWRWVASFMHYWSVNTLSLCCEYPAVLCENATAVKTVRCDEEHGQYLIFFALKINSNVIWTKKIMGSALPMATFSCLSKMWAPDYFNSGHAIRVNFKFMDVRKLPKNTECHRQTYRFWCLFINGPQFGSVFIKPNYFIPMITN
jgi:hypothetical protein